MATRSQTLAGNGRRLVLLATNDLHMHLTGWDYAKDRALPSGGLTRLAALIEEIRSAAFEDGADVLLFDNGDALQGTALGDLAASEESASAGGRHPLMQAFDIMGYDAIGLGNHDFDFGIEPLERILANAPCPVICSNLERECDTALQAVLPHVVLQLGPSESQLRVGVLSVLPPNTAFWNARRLSGRVRFADMVSALERGASELRARGCDLVVALAHTGFPADTGPDGGLGDTENVLDRLAEIDGLDAAFGGHTHLAFAGKVPGGHVPVAAASHAGRELARIDLDLRRDPCGWRVVRAEPGLIPAADKVSAPMLDRVLAPWHKATRDRMNTLFGQSPRRLHSYFSMVAPDAHLQFLAEAQVQAVEVFRERFGGLPVLSAVAALRFGGRGGADNFTDVRPGPVAHRHVQDLVPFDNTICALRLTGAQVLDWLEMSAGVFNTLSPGVAPVELLNETWPAHGFDTLFGLRYRIDLRFPARFGLTGRLQDDGPGRVRDLSFNDVPVAPDDRFVVLLNDYRANGGGNVPGLSDAPRIPLPDIRLRGAVSDAFRALPRSTLQLDPWRIVGPRGARAIFRTAPRAAAYLPEIAQFAPVPGPLDEAGFLPVTIRL